MSGQCASELTCAILPRRPLSAANANPDARGGEFWQPLHHLRSGGSAPFAAPIQLIPYLGDNPDLANAAQMSGFIGDGVFRPPSITFPVGDWENLLDLGFDGGTMRNHIQVLVSVDATFQNGEMVPEPATESQVGLAFGIILVMAYRKRKLLQPELIRK